MAVTGAKKKQIAILNGGGDAPALNAVIRGITVKAISLGYDVLGFRRGWAGLLGKGEPHPLDLDRVQDIHMLGGTILRTSRTNPYKVEGGVEQVKKNLKKFRCDYLIAIGGDDTLGVAWKLHQEGVKAVGVPKTIDNDVNATDYTFGFDTAVNIAADAIDNLHTTAKSHDRVLVVEVMGRHAGWLTLHAGMAGGAHIILVPEEKFDMKEIVKIIKNREKKGYHYTIIACSEGAVPKEGGMVLQTDEKDAFGNVRLGGIAQRLAKVIQKETGKETRHVVLGHLQRAGHPTAFDRVLGTRLGVHAAEMIHKKEFGKISCLKGTEIVSQDMKAALGQLKTVPKKRVEEARLFFGLEG
ncbi:ATP-dependent 6-phosphofructokinase [Candidatus Woesearchaeota archaeon]|nr:ATP-dependent 6-phosphofructokinase [Candidatus Woesearchaeota archaeon]